MIAAADIADSLLLDIAWSIADKNMAKRHARIHKKSIINRSRRNGKNALSQGV